MTRQNRLGMPQILRRDAWLIIFCLPAVIYMVTFNYAPIWGLQIAFKKFSAARGIWGSRWIGFSNFTRYFSSVYFGRTFGNTLLLSLLLTVRYALLLGGAAYIYVFRGPVRIRPTVFGKLSAVFLSGMLLALIYLHDYGVPLVRERVSGLLEIALAILLVGTILHVLVMGVYSLRLYPRVVPSEESTVV